MRGVKASAIVYRIIKIATGSIFCIEEESYDAEVFLRFLREVLDKYPKGKIVIILDNSRIHHAKLLKEFLEARWSGIRPVLWGNQLREAELARGIYEATLNLDGAMRDERK